MILAVDCGNTRLKWGLYQGGAWRKTGAVDLARVGSLEPHWRKLSAVRKVVVANVAGAPARAKLAGIFSRLRLRAVWVEAKRRECGVTNGYLKPAQLGADRWAALIGAWSIVRGPCLIVMAGTATTADILGSDGKFCGGAILPGLEMMKRSLATDTAGLPRARGHFAVRPRRTADAIETGCLLAQVGAIERLFFTLERGATCLLAGGTAARIAPHLRIRARKAENLVLEGLVRIAAAE
jgi:type III pantothenate kinase